MRLVTPILVAILLLSSSMTGFVVAPCHAITSDPPLEEATPIITNAILSGDEIIPSKVSLQTSYLSLSLTTNKSVYLTGETVSITVSTNAINTHIRLLAQLPGGSQETIDNITTNATHTLSWQAPSTPGQVRLTCEGEAIVEVWETCARYVCVDQDCRWDSYPCTRSMSVTGNAFSDIRVFSRTTSISGYITDTNQRPVPGATAYLSSTMQSTTSNSDGYYEFSPYQLDNNYALVNQIPTVTETVSVEAIACEPQPGKSVQVQAERDAPDVNFTLKRYFYPADIDLSQFTFAAFPGWQEANEYTTWQDILGITIDGTVEPRKLSYGTKDISPPLFNVGNKKLYLITKPELGRYFLELQGTRNTDYTVAAATTLNNIYLEPVTVSGNIRDKNDQRLRLMLEADGMELKVIKSPSLLLIIIPIVVGLLGGIAVAYFFTGGKFHGTRKETTVRKPPKTKKTAKGRAGGKSTARKTREVEEKSNKDKGKSREKGGAKG